ncbi:hypothetical protein MPTK1_5g05880 [Marchantia polymorpha subsp. ruderalis]|uniref:Uncharacterized protein n=2 Tax=Marchantia polymorpha TaxID=3197 RepID=A0AAF6BFE3_MARPO|nr:hypothetical protein MARPO_0027s0039 [Marchantia polymorpha]BBN10727.1 hypothetical protein Mp_5g05880 [Marchantia polymorpha subsp. ruderalis]|eukprot:PTQ42907.1 hypothetical protein MARPO_0027s0039 [Marchantia polymorpha]
MGPKNGAVLQRQKSNSGKELSWIDRMQLKLDSLCEMDTGRNPAEGIHDSSLFFESQFSQVGTNVRKFCAEFVRELLVPEDCPSQQRSSEVAATEDSAAVASSGADRPSALGLEGANASGLVRRASSIMVTAPPEIVAEAVRSVPAKPPLVPEAPVFFIGNEQSEQDLGTSKFADEDADQYAHWFVSEEYRRMRLGKSTSTSSIQSWDGHHRAPSSDSLLDWELI